MLILKYCFLTSSFTLLHLPLSEPTFVERQTDIYAERILGDKGLRILAHPLRRDVEQRAVVITVNNWYTETSTDAVLLRSVLSFYLQIVGSV